jgi:hypothetical protein
MNADRAVKAYKTMMMYENMILAGNNTKAMREMYIRASERIDESAQIFMLFVLMGFGVPWGTFVLGNLWLKKR